VSWQIREATQKIITEIHKLRASIAQLEDELDQLREYYSALVEDSTDCGVVNYPEVDQ
jgi:outer membrane murein-binding lipoprotein Lpp